MEQAVMELLSHKYSIDETPTVKEILAHIKKSQPDQVNDREIKQVWVLLHLRKKHVELTEIPFYNQPYNKYCMLILYVDGESS